MTNTRPTTPIEKEVMEFLNSLRKSGQCNMFGASPYIEKMFSMKSKEARKLLSLWMDNFNEEGKYDSVINQ